VKKRYTFDSTFNTLTMGTKNEIKVVSKELTKYRVSMTATIDIEVDVYAEDEHEARNIAEQEVCVAEYANDTIGIEINSHWCVDISRDGEQKVEIVGIGANGFVEEYDTTSKGSIALYAREEDGFEDPENVFTDEQELMDYYAEDEDEDDSDDESIEEEQ
jgi:hypothetical protein